MKNYEEPTDDSEEEEKVSPKKKASASKKKTGYAYYCSHNRETVKEDNPDMKGNEITKELARQWKELSKEEQKEWSESAANLE